MKKIFYDVKFLKKKVLVLDEFDCVQGIIKNRSNINQSENKYNNESSKLKQLKERQIKIMKLLVNDTTIQKNKDVVETNHIKIELKEISDQIKNEENSLSLDTMLQVLDGVIEMRGRVIIATTNHIENIDPALLRAGRFDIKIELNEFNNEEAHELLNKMYSNSASKSELKLLNKTKIKEIYTPTQLINIASSYENLAGVLNIIRE